MTDRPSCGAMRTVNTTQSETALSALEHLYREHHRRVRWVVRSRGVPESALDDVVQDVFLSIYRRWAKRDTDVPVHAWVTGVARSVAFAHRRAAVRRAERRQVSALAPAEFSQPDDDVERAEAWSTLRDFLQSLPDEQREVFVQAMLLGASAPEISQMTRTQLNTVYSRLRLARRRFADQFGFDAAAPEAAVHLERAGRQERPPAQRTHAMWVLIVGKVAATTAAPAVAGSGLAAAWWWALGLAATVTVTVVVAPRAASDDTADPVRNVAAPQPELAALASTNESAEQPAKPTVEDPSTAPEPVPVVASPHPAPVRTRRRSNANLDPQAAPDSAATLDAEAKMLREAQEFLARDRPAQALRQIQKYRQTFDHGLLDAERKAIEREAICATDADRCPVTDSSSSGATSSR